ncbi:MAG: hypothetical protein B5M52_00855 [Helicobacteraceae bacterium 4484_230]|nr:MAG: hypothetical protein B5M52_00855 [Helicobacteraceae bacterium 4484_230]
MKKIVVTLFACSILLSAAPWERHHINSEFATLQTFTNDIIDNTDQIEFANSDKQLGTTGAVQVGDDINLLDLSMRYQPIDHLGFDIRLPVVSNDIADEFGIGDFSLSANYHFGQPEADFGTNITTLRYKTTSGNEDKGLGTGEGSFTLTHTTAKDIAGGFRLHGLLTYTLNSGDIDDSFAVMFGGSHECLLSEYVTTNVKITYFDQDKLGVADLWVEWSTEKIIPGAPLSAGLKIPLINKLDGDSLHKSVLFYVSASSFFL